MKLIHAPKDGERQEWAIDVEELKIGEIKVFEKVTGLTMAEIGDALERGSFTVMVTLLWLFRRRHEPDLKLSDFDDIRVTEFQVEADDDEADEAEATTDDPKGPTGPVAVPA